MTRKALIEHISSAPERESGRYRGLAAAPGAPQTGEGGPMSAYRGSTLGKFSRKPLNRQNLFQGTRTGILFSHFRPYLPLMLV